MSQDPQNMPDPIVQSDAKTDADVSAQSAQPEVAESPEMAQEQLAPETPSPEEEVPNEALPVDEVSALEEKVLQLNDAYLRARAENENLRRRHERDLQKAYDFSTERLIRDLLPVLDSMSLGLEAAQKSGETTNAAFIEGTQMTLKLMLEVLQKHGCEVIDPQGEKFDPNVHEAVSTLPDAEHEANTVLHVAQKGYVLNGRTIRPAQVVVSAKPAPEP